MIQNISSKLLWPQDPPAGNSTDDFLPSLDIYLLNSKEVRGAVLICPGGAYSHRAPHEGDDIATYFNKAGWHAFVVQYRVSPNIHPAPLFDAERAMRIIRSNASEWQVDPERIAVCGFSAGGHLAASLGVFYHEADDDCNDIIERQSSRPDAMILCYPVISAGAFRNTGSFKNLLGDPPPAELMEKLSLEKQVHDKMPPAFIWHTSTDPGVPVENSLLFAQALREKGISIELHLYREGGHGLGLAEGHPHLASWAGLCCQWLQELGW